MRKTIGVDAAKLAGLQIDMLQKLRDGQMTITQMEWYLGLKKEEREWLFENNGASKNPHFRRIFGFSFFVPDDFSSSTCVSDFVKKHDSDSRLLTFDCSLINGGLKRASDMLIPGHEIEVQCFRILKKGISLEDCTAFIIGKGGIFVGAEGLVLAFQNGQDKFPGDLKIISFLEKGSLSDQLPYIYIYPISKTGCFHFLLSRNHKFLQSVDCDSSFLVFRDVTSQNEMAKR